MSRSPLAMQKGDLADLVVLRLTNGSEWKVPWCMDLRPAPAPIKTALLPRMPLTAEERFWLWAVIPPRLAIGGSVRFVGPSLHD